MRDLFSDEACDPPSEHTGTGLARLKVGAGCLLEAPKVMIPKPDGSQRELGLRTVTHRLIQQALLQGAATAD